ncbi:hypothetical protein ACL9RL_00220 [Plantibacter sp. Mn2098]|uniref:hypothetical protein n=1 Tax=Plantibacter sp. Mn2098 TaxID=3395266 RepID=UPI003BC81C87
MSGIDIAGAAHARTARLDVREITRRLNAALGATLVAALAGSKDRSISNRWAKVDGPVPKPETVRRLQFAYRQWEQIAQAESEHVARMWFISANPLLGEETPIDAIREDRFKETAAAVEFMVDDSFAG